MKKYTYKVAVFVETILCVVYKVFCLDKETRKVKKKTEKRKGKKETTLYVLPKDWHKQLDRKVFMLPGNKNFPAPIFPSLKKKKRSYSLTPIKGKH